MNPRVLPDSTSVEDHVRVHVIRHLETNGATVESTVRGDTSSIPFDWLIRLHTRAPIGLEVVRAEDEDQIRHVESSARDGESAIAGSAEMPWASLRRVVTSKLSKASRYREALHRIDPAAELHLAVASVLQTFDLDGELGEHIKTTALLALDEFDAIWLIERDNVRVYS